MTRVRLYDDQRRVFGLTKIGWINILVLQWFGLRLAAECETVGMLLTTDSPTLFRATGPLGVSNANGENLGSSWYVSRAHDGQVAASASVITGWSVRPAWPLARWSRDCKIASIAWAALVAALLILRG